MNGDRYEWLITNNFASWRQACFEDDEPVSLVQDRERCHWQDRNFKALRQTGCPVVDQHPKHSPHMNAIEGWWKLLRQRLEVTEPEEFVRPDRYLYICSTASFAVDELLCIRA